MEWGLGFRDLQLDPGFRELTVLEKSFSKIGILFN